MWFSNDDDDNDDRNTSTPKGGRERERGNTERHTRQGISNCPFRLAQSMIILLVHHAERGRSKSGEVYEAGVEDPWRRVKWNRERKATHLECPSSQIAPQ